jgi:hypothetical protein
LTIPIPQIIQYHGITVEEWDALSDSRRVKLRTAATMALAREVYTRFTHVPTPGERSPLADPGAPQPTGNNAARL